MRKEKLTNFKGLLELVEERENLNLITKKAKVSNNPKDVLNTIKKCEKLARETPDNDLAAEILAELPKLRMVLLNLFKREHQKCLDVEYQKIQQKTAEYSAGMRERLANFRRQYSEA